MAITVKPKFPNVPALPGVPQLLRSPVFPASAVPVLLGGLAIGQLFQALTAQVVWGVFDSEGRNVIQPDSVVDFGIRNAYSVTTAPVERGSFFAYNKVATPYEPFVRMTKGGTEDERAAFLDSVDATLNDATTPLNQALPLYTIMTPERSYQRVTLQRTELLRRDVKGAFFVDIDLYFMEIRQIEAQYTTTAASTQNAQNVAALPPLNLLRVQAQVPPLGTAFAAAGALRLTP